jgi:multiple sugar transport system substrate-binding protein
MAAKRMAILIAAVALLAQVACSGNQEATGSDSSTDLEVLDPSGQEVVFWYQHTREREDALVGLIEEFNSTNEYGISVRGEYAGKYNNINSKMIVAMQSGTIPDLLVAYQNQARAYYGGEGIIDLMPYLQSPKWGLEAADCADFFEAFLAQDRLGEVQICFPPNRSVEVLYYNLDWLRELGFDGPPATWDEFATMCRAARDQPFSKSANKARSLGFMLEIDASRLASLVFGRGGDFMNAEQSAYTLNTPQVRSALTDVMTLIAEGAAEQLGEDYGDQNEFSVGQLLFALRSSSGLSFLRSAVEEDGVGFAWGVTHPPHGEAGPVVNVYGASLAVGRTTPERQLAAWLFVKWFTQAPQQARWVRASNYFPVRKSTAHELQEYFDENPQYCCAYDLLEYGRSEPSVAGYQQVRRMIEDAMVAVLDGEDMGAVLAALENRANRTLGKQ